MTLDLIKEKVAQLRAEKKSLEQEIANINAKLSVNAVQLPPLEAELARLEAAEAKTASPKP